jgi:hypothetical protein
MSMKGSCNCSNIEVTWQTVDYSLVPRACQCDYCAQKSAAYVSKSGTKFEVLIRNDDLYRTVQHGSNSAVFHECGNCNQVIFVTAEIEDELYGALNANYLNNKLGFSAPVKVNFSAQSAEQKRERWRLNWCQPVLIFIRDPDDNVIEFHQPAAL